jgi:catechol 2,3-dioxygenase-like lactoylglutathione lyase family enzyme
MFDHLGFGVTDYAKSRAFFLQALEPLGIGVVMEGEHGLGLGPKGKPALWLHATSDKPAPLHIAFVAQTREQVHAFHRAALAAGGKDNGAPGLRPHYHPHYYGAFVIGPDGHNVEAVCHAPAA